jgi:hypothetical protein
MLADSASAARVATLAVESPVRLELAGDSIPAMAPVVATFAVFLAGFPAHLEFVALAQLPARLEFVALAQLPVCLEFVALAQLPASADAAAMNAGRSSDLPIQAAINNPGGFARARSAPTPEGRPAANQGFSRPFPA